MQQDEDTLINIIEHLRVHFYETFDEKQLDLYVRARACVVNRPQAQVDILEAIEEDFLSQEDKRSLLVLGDSGLGKSTLGLYLTRHLWAQYETGAFVPLFIHLPTIAEKDRQEELLTAFLKDDTGAGLALTKKERHLLRQKARLLLILDGLDEIPWPENLYQRNRWDQDDIKVITTCRPEVLPRDYARYFYPMKGGSGAFLQYQLQPFDSDQITDYCEQYILSRWEEYEAASEEARAIIAHERPYFEEKETYLEEINRIPGLEALCTTPFVLSLVVDVLPLILRALEDEHALLHQRPLTRTQLYDHFTHAWFLRQARRLQGQPAFSQLGLQASTADLAAYLRLYSENLAARVLKEGRLEVVITDEPQHPLTLEVDLLYARKVSDESHLRYLAEDRATLSAREDQAGMRWIRSGCLLTTQGTNSFSFLHKSLVEYFTANELFSSVLDFNPGDLLAWEEEDLTLEEDAFERLKRLSFNDQLIVKERGILRVLADRVQTDEAFKAFLTALIEQSKGVHGYLVETAAANAISVLNVAYGALAHLDCRYIRIPGADLSHACLYGKDFTGADVRGVRFHQADLRQVIFTGAWMSGVSFGERPYLQASSAVKSIMFSADGRYLAVGNHKGYVAIYDADTHQKITTLKDGVFFFSNSNNPADALAFSPSNPETGLCDSFAVGSREGCIRLYHTRGWRLYRTLKGHRARVLSVAYHPSGEQLASGSKDQTTRLWEVATGACAQTLRGHDGSVWSVAYHPSGEQLASGSKDQTIRLWDVATGVCTQTLAGHRKDVQSVTYHPSGGQLASGSWDETIRLWDVVTGACIQTLAGHSNVVLSVAYHPSGEQLASGSGDQTIRLWEVATGKCLQLIKAFQNAVLSVAFDPSGDTLVTGESTNAVSVFRRNRDGLFELVWRQPPRFSCLLLDRCQIDGVMGLSKTNERLLFQRGAIGTPSNNTRLSDHHLPALCYPSVRGSDDFLPGIFLPDNPINTDRWYVYLVRKRDKNHAFLLIEGVQNGERHIVRAELRTDQGTSGYGQKGEVASGGSGRAFITLKTLESLHRLVEEAENYCYQGWQIRATTGRQLIKAIDQDRYAKIAYSYSGIRFFHRREYNCLSWCWEKLRDIGLLQCETWLAVPAWVLTDNPINVQNGPPTHEGGGCGLM